MFNRPLTIGTLTIKNRALLAPLAGVSDVPFRRICREFGVGLTYVEMLSAAAVIHKSPRTLAMMARHSSEDVLGVQVSGPTAAEVATAVRMLDEHGFDTIDINMGCPVRKIVSAGWGSAFHKDLDRLFDTVKQARAATAKPLTVKCRLGFTRAAINVEDVAARVLEAGADMLTIHGRTRNDTYQTPVDYSGIARGFMPVRGKIVTVGNGDNMNFGSARRMVDETGCDAVMISRGSFGNPWIFRSLLAGEEQIPSVTEWRDVVLRHLAYQEEFYGEGLQPAMRLRKQLVWYVRGFPHNNRFRDRAVRVQSLAEARNLVKDYYAYLPPDCHRYEAGSTAPAMPVAIG